MMIAELLGRPILNFGKEKTKNSKGLFQHIFFNYIGAKLVNYSPYLGFTSDQANMLLAKIFYAF